MTSVTDLALRRLLERAENAYGKEQKRKVNLLFTVASFKHYLNIPTWAEKSVCHGELQLAENVGAILIVWNVRAGPGNQIDAIELADADVLADHIKKVPRWRAVQNASATLSTYVSIFPVLADVIENWSQGKRPNSTGAEDAADWGMAAQVIVNCRAAGTIDVPIRRISTALLFNSKKLEELIPLLDALLQGELYLEPREDNDVLNEIGIIKYPPTLLVSGQILISLKNGESFSPCHPYIGLAPEEIVSVTYDESRSPILMTVENLTTFHELSRLRKEHPGIVVLYTGGMPSPSFKRVYSEFLASLSGQSVVYHWGDCDLGGFRIADHLAQCCILKGQTLLLHQMAPMTSPETRPYLRQLVSTDLKAIAKICQRHGWIDELKAIEECRVAIEQEGLPIIWPAYPAPLPD
ncbi:MAG: Wadjet anti-phage system protein JetD domain-containing protein [Undibacterium umbellatum]|uniref:Wadjet anti-phage system protein JetD domain-containing protein n=1 Tax=Undibacterium umbellatum TaxID=2762300 RepID=UPI003BB4DA10